jgi:hypothetical protein
MTITEVINRVTTEKQTHGRFPSRVIFARNWADYAKLVKDLQNVCDITLNLAKFAHGDIFPNFKDLKNELTEYAEKQILLLSFGEYLRLCGKREADKENTVFKTIWEPDPVQLEHSKTKYIIPLFGGRELFDNAVRYVDKRQEDFLWELKESPYDSEYTVTVYSPSFVNAVSVDAINFSDWLSKWDTLFADKARNSFSLITKLYRYTEKMFGNVKIEIVDEPFLYIVSLVTDGNTLKKEYGDELFWSEIAGNVQRENLFSATIDHILNIGHTFDPVSVLSRFDQLTDVERRLFWIRYKIYSTSDYYSYAIGKASTPNAISSTLCDSIFELQKPSGDYIRERLKAISALNLTYGNDYFSKLEKIQPVELRLSYLTYKTHEERTYAIKTVSGLLRIGTDVNVIADMLKQNYQTLAEYLLPTDNKNDDISKYFNWYRKSKLINRRLEDIPFHIDFDSIDSRNKIIQTIDTGYPLWVDGLGAEWLPLLLFELKKLSMSAVVDSKIATSRLPSETEFNHQWSEDDEKWDRLDKLSHNGMPDDKDYFSCIATQIEYICAITRHVDMLLVEHNCVIITGDHGSSRLAALMFHASDNFAITPPKNVIVRSFGRFCELLDDTDVPTTPSMEVVNATGTGGKNVKCIVMKTYEHFKQSGNAAGGNTDDNAVAGEVHGGMTPEEYLVPVIVVKRRQPLPDIKEQEMKKPKIVTINGMGIP